MTGFASVVVDCRTHRITWELRSVNHRYLDVSFRLPEEYRRYEPEYRSAVGERLRRGKVECVLRIAPVEGELPPGAVDEHALERLSSLQNTLRARFPDAAPLSVAELLRWPGVLVEPAVATGELVESVASGLDEAAARLAAARESEGRRIAELLEQRNAAIVDLVTAVRPLAEALPERHAEKLAERLARIDVEADPARLETELALVAQRLDVSEELDRIQSHVQEIRAGLRRAEPVGRKLDFLIQELNREANTLTSKAPDQEITRRAVELKVLIEQMREQVQNLE